MLKVPANRRSIFPLLHYRMQFIHYWQQTRISSSFSGHSKGGTKDIIPMNGETDYSQWSPGKLIKRVTSLEAQLREQTIRLVGLFPILLTHN